MWSYRSSSVEVSAEDGLGSPQVEFSRARYEPMVRLMSNEDLEFLKAQPGFKPEIAKKFSRERRRIFRLYLQELARDFHRLHAYASSIVAALPAEQSPLVGLLVRQKMRFWYELTAVEVRVSLDAVGLGSLDARGLVDALASMHADISRASVATA